MTWLLTLLVGCEPDTTTVVGDGLSVVLADVEGLVLAQRFGVIPDQPSAVSLRCTGADDPDEVHVLESPSAAAHDLVLFGLLGGTAYDCAVSAGAAQAAFRITTAPLPDWAPAWTVTGATRGYTLFNHVLNGLDANDQKLLIVDPQGRVRWYYLLPEQVAGDVDSRWLGDGSILYGGGYGARPRRIDLAGETLYRSASPLTGRSHHHHTEWLAGGEVLSLVTTANLVSEVKEDWTGFGIEVVDPESGSLVWSWDSQVAVDAGQLPVPTGDGDPYHANWAWWTSDADGPAVYLSLRDRDAILRLDRDTGRFTWTLGVDGDFALLDAAGAPADPASWFYLQHAPELTGDTLVVYDNGLGRPGGSFSRVVMYRLDVPGRTLQETWSWTEDHWREPVWGDADLLDDGHVLVARGHCWDCSSADVDGRSALIELDPALDAPTWRLDFDGDRDGLYRAQRIDGCELFANQRWCD